MRIHVKKVTLYLHVFARKYATCYPLGNLDIKLHFPDMHSLRNHQFIVNIIVKGLPVVFRYLMT